MASVAHASVAKKKTFAPLTSHALINYLKSMIRCDIESRCVDIVPYNAKIKGEV